MPRPLLIIPLLLALAGCASMATERLADNLSRAILNQDDPETVRAGAPSFLLLIDGLIEGAPRDAHLLLSGAKLYSAYAGVFVDEPARARRLAGRALGYARRAACDGDARLCGLETLPYPALDARLAQLTSGELELLYGYAAVWAGWIEAHAGDWRAHAQLARVERMMGRAAAIDERHDGGRIHLYLAVMKTLLPAALGGRPEVGRGHFERAIELSGGRDLKIKVEFARRYARLQLDRELHDRLLGEVITADPVAPGLTLGNTLAQREARALLAESADYFPEPGTE